jgi:hypothetical protein
MAGSRQKIRPSGKHKRNGIVVHTLLSGRHGIAGSSLQVQRRAKARWRRTKMKFKKSIADMAWQNPPQAALRTEEDSLHAGKHRYMAGGRKVVINVVITTKMLRNGRMHGR